MAKSALIRKKQCSEKFVATRYPALEGHLRQLGLKSIVEYLEWCVCHRFAPRLDKTPLKRQQEVQAAQEVRIQKCLVKKPVTARDVIQAIFRGLPVPENCLGRDWFTVTVMYQELSQQRHLLPDAVRLLSHIAECEGFFRSGQAEVFGLSADCYSYAHGLLSLIYARRGWIRPVETWKPKGHHPRQLFSSLARHLFAKYPVPLFMDAVWFPQGLFNADRIQGWFQHLGLGLNLRTADLPIRYTKRMAHHFMQAPVHYSLADALRWGQILALGGNARLVEAVCATNLSEDFTDDEFWVSVFRFFIANPQLHVSHVGPMIDFLRDQRQPGFQIDRHGQHVEVPATDTKYSMKGRTPQSLMRQMEDWHRRLEEIEQPDVEWGSLGVEGYEQIDGCIGSETFRKWTVTELRSARELIAEGRAMHHCVASYIDNCLQGGSSIWAIRLETPDGITSQVTIEVRPSRKAIVQARGRYNDNLSGYQRLILNRWARTAGLSLADYD